MQSQYRHSKHSISRGSTNFSLFYYIPEQGRTGPEGFLTLYFELIEALVHWERWTERKLRTTLCFTALEGGKRRTRTVAAPGCKHISKLFLFLNSQLAQHSELRVFLWWGQPWQAPLLSQKQKRMWGDKLVTAQCSPLHRPVLDACRCAVMSTLALRVKTNFICIHTDTEVWHFHILFPIYSHKQQLWSLTHFVPSHPNSALFVSLLLTSACSQLFHLTL